MAQRGRSPGFLYKTFLCLRIPRQLRRQKLEGDCPFELCVLGLIDDTHTAFAEFFDYLIVRDS